MNRSHGHCVGRRVSPELCSYNNMVNRCTDSRNKCWDLYGGRGVTVCARWLLSFENFLSDMGTKPSKKHSLDRIDNSKGYEPSNCRWATSMEQGRNKRSNRLLVFNGHALCITEWAERSGVNAQTIRTRLSRGWPIDRALTEPSILGKNQFQKGHVRFDERDIVPEAEVSAPMVAGD